MLGYARVTVRYSLHSGGACETWVFPCVLLLATRDPRQHNELLSGGRQQTAEAVYLLPEKVVTEERYVWGEGSEGRNQ